MNIPGLPISHSHLNPINNNISMNINVMNQPFTQPNTQLNLSEESCTKEDFDLISTKYEKLRKDYEEYMLNSNLKLNENTIINSVAFKSIIEQSESNLDVINQLKEMYLKQKQKYDELIRENDLDIKKIEDKINKTNENYKKKYFDVKDENNQLKSEITKLNYKITELEAIKSDNVNFNEIFELFDKEKKRFNLELSNIMKLLTEQKEKLSKEVEKNITTLEENYNLKQELEEQKARNGLISSQTQLNQLSKNGDLAAKNLIQNLAKNPEKDKENLNNLSLKEKDKENSLNMNVSLDSSQLIGTFNNEDKYKQKFSELYNSIKSKKERIQLLEKKYQKYKEELASEKQVNESLLRELEANEIGLTDMNSQIFNLQEQIQKENQKVALLTKEKIINQQNIDKLTSEREQNKTLVSLHKNQKIEIESQIKKLNEDILYLKNIISSNNETIQSKDKEIISVNTQLGNQMKEFKENESLVKQQQRIIEEITNEKCILKNELDLINLNSKKKEKEKQNKSNSIIKDSSNDDELKQEYDILKVSKY